MQTGIIGYSFFIILLMLYRVEKGLLSRMHAEEDDEDDLMFTSATLRNSEKLVGKLYRRKVAPHKRHMTDDELGMHSIDDNIP